jgi:uncharacterized repeat protein (TIGR01451 family)
MPRFNTAARIAAITLAVVVTESCSSDTRPGVVVDPQLMSAAGSISVNLDQCANDPVTSNCNWQNGDLNGSNSVYAEGRVVPFRLSIEGLTPGQHSIRLNYDFTAGGEEGYDFLATYNATELVDLCAVGGGGVSSLCPSLGLADTEEFTTNLTFGVLDANNLLVKDAEVFANLVGKRNLTMYGGTIVSISAPEYSGNTGANSSADVVVTFNATGSSVLLAWGAHLAQSAYWKEGLLPDGSGEISGAPWHMRTQKLDDANANKNQDRSIQPSALVENPTLALAKTPSTQTVSAGEAFSWTITLTNNGPGTATGATITDNLPSVTGVTYALDGTSDQSCSLVANALECGPADLAQGATLVAKINATTTPNQGCVAGGFTNTATGVAGNAAQVTATATTTLNCPALTIAKTPNAGTLTPPGNASFTIVVTNTGAGKAFDVALTDQLLADLTWTVTPGYTGWTTCAINGTQLLTCNLATLNAGASASVTVTAPVTSGFVFVPNPAANGTQLEIDGNVLPQGGLDWETPGFVSCVPQILGCSLDESKNSGSPDNAMVNGTKEDDPVPSLDFGGIPPEKSDLHRFYIRNNRALTNPADANSPVHDFLYLAWERVNNPNGTTNMDFEFNQSTTLSSNGQTPVRTAGDILIEYNLSSGGDNLTMLSHRWITSGNCALNGSKPPCWDAGVVLNPNAFTGAVNTLASIDDHIDPGDRTLSPFTFGEVRIDMQAAQFFTGQQCTSFGRAYLKSRSSDTFSSVIKDFISPVPISITNCTPRTIPNTASVSATNVTAITDDGQITVTVP